MKTLLLLVALLATTATFAQPRIDIAENTFRLAANSEEVFYYGLAEGDQLVFDYRTVKGRKLREIEISEINSSSLFTDYDSKKVKNKIIRISKTGIYKFRFTNSTYKKRVCRFKIQRIPGSSNGEFNPTVLWRTVHDTTYTTIQEDYLISKDTVIHNLTDQVAKVHSQTNNAGNKTTYNFNLPKHTVSWSYYIGVGQEGEKAYNDATAKIAKYGSKAALAIPGYGPMAALALNLAPYLTQLQKGEDINYYIADMDNAVLFTKNEPFNPIKKGLVINDFASMAPRTGLYYVCLENDNAVTGVTVVVKVTAVTVKENWGKRSVQKMNIASRREAYLENN